MKEYKYVPELKDKKGKLLFKGHILIEIPRLKQRNALARTLKMKMNAKGELDPSEDPLEIIEKSEEIALKHIKEVDLKYGSESFKSIEDLEYARECRKLLQAVASLVLNGYSVEKLGND